MNILETTRLTLSLLSTEDAPFIFTLLNSPSWIQFIGDRGIRTIEDARIYIVNGPLTSYNQFGFGLYIVKLKENSLPIGLCGLIKRETLEDPDAGYAFLPAYEGNGYASEATRAVVDYARSILGIGRIVAITTLNNYRSIRVLEKVGFVFEKQIRLLDNELMLFTNRSVIERLG